MMTYKQMARLVASKLSNDQLVELAVLLDGDSGSDFCHHIQEVCEEANPDLYASHVPSLKVKAIQAMNPSDKPCHECGSPEGIHYSSCQTGAEEYEMKHGL